MMMKDYFVHYHAFPRYDKEVSLFGKVWKDNDWPGSINFKSGDIIDDDLLLKIKSFMIE